MIRYPLYVGGFILLPEPAIRALYLFQEKQGKRLDEQIAYVLKSITFDYAVSELNEYRDRVALLNGIAPIESLEEILSLLAEVNLLNLTDGEFRINYLATIEGSELKLDEQTLNVIQEVRGFVEISSEVVDYINTWDLLNRKQPINDSYPVRIAHHLIDEDDSPADIGYTNLLIYEVSQLNKNNRGDA